MSRVAWKVPYITPFLFSKAYLNIDNIQKKKPRVWTRNTLISSGFVGRKFRVFNGKEFITVTIGLNMVGHKLGEFSITKVLGHRTSKSKKTKGKKK